MELHNEMMEYLNLAELKIIFFELGLDYDQASGDGSKEKILWLIRYCAARNQLDKLIEACKKQNNVVTWSQPTGLPQVEAGDEGKVGVNTHIEINQKISESEEVVGFEATKGFSGTATVIQEIKNSKGIKGVTLDN